MDPKIAFVGAGAIGGYVGGVMAKAGQDVTLIDMWPEHVDAIRKHGMQYSGMTPAETCSIPVRALHVSDVQSLGKERPVDIAFIVVKSYDTAWATAMIKPYLAPDGFVVSLQNCINEERIAEIVGWGKTVGAIMSRLGVELTKPGHLERTVPLNTDGKHTVFRVGEVHGKQTERLEKVTELLQLCDTTKMTMNLWGERWSKQVLNSMRNGLSAVTGMGAKAQEQSEVARWIGIRLGSEAVRVGQGLGYTLENMQGLDPDMLARAGETDKDALEKVTRILIEEANTRSDENRPSLAQDMAKGRRTEIDDINGYIVKKGAEIGIPAPVNAKVMELVERVGRGELKPGLAAVAGV